MFFVVFNPFYVFKSCFKTASSQPFSDLFSRNNSICLANMWLCRWYAVGNVCRCVFKDYFLMYRWEVA